MIKITVYSLLMIGTLFALFVLADGRASSQRIPLDQHPANLDLLLGIYLEVRELGYRADEDFIKREFHVELDGRRSNREEHIVVLSHKEGPGEKMIVQITFFDDCFGTSSARLARETREIMSLVAGKEVKITHCDFNDTEMRTLLPAVLNGIREEKKLLRRVRR